MATKRKARSKPAKPKDMFSLTTPSPMGLLLLYMSAYNAGFEAGKRSRRSRPTKRWSIV